MVLIMLLHLSIWEFRIDIGALNMKNVLEYLEFSEQRNGTGIAIIDPNNSYSYTEYMKLCQNVGAHLASKISIKQPVAVYMDKSCDSMIAFMGIVYAGGFYTQINKTYPSTRIQSVLQTLECKYIITNREEEQSVREQYGELCEVLLIEELKEDVLDINCLKTIRKMVIDTDPLYANFTSGSTGTPKGVCVCHRSVIDFIDVFTETLGLKEDDVIGNQAPFDFDVSVKDIYSALRLGATLLIIPTPYFSKPIELMDYLCNNNVTTIIWAVSAMCIISTLRGFDYRVPERLRNVMFSGEVMPLKHLHIWMNALPDATFVNLYGPTEITCNCTYYVIPREQVDSMQQIPIGVAFDNERVFLLDENDQLITEPGVEGELCVAGTSLALGYYNAWERTNENFVQNPLNKQYPELIYRTGDISKYDENGLLYYVSRKDFQIKHMGHRIELNEIDAQIMKEDGVVRVCCIYHEQKQRIIAFYEGSIDEKSVRARLTENLPTYMLPNKLMQLESLPITQRGKIDRAKLREIYEESKGRRKHGRNE